MSLRVGGLSAPSPLPHSILVKTGFHVTPALTSALVSELALDTELRF